jgi:hypothetical protein
MDTKRSFKFERAIPRSITNGDPAFSLFSVRGMLQIPTLAGVVTSTGIASPIMTCYVPRGAWGLSKNILLRGTIELVFPGGPLPVSYNIIESIGTSQSSPIVIPGAPAFAPIAGRSSSMRQINFTRMFPAMNTMDVGQCWQHATLNSWGAISYVMPITATAGLFDYSQVIILELLLALPAHAPAITATCDWCEAFMEQGVRAGTLSP